MKENTEHYHNLKQEEEKDVYFGIINRFIGYFTIESQKESQNDSATEYPFVPMDTRQMFKQIQLARTHLLERGQAPSTAAKTFIDIGCGIGNVLLVAEQMDFDVFGIEKDEYPFKIAQKIIGDDKVAMEDIWDFGNYDTFDVIYYFRPFHEGNMQRKFEKFIEDNLKPGGILIANRKMSDDINKDKRFRRLDKDLPVWEKIESPQEI